MRIIAAFESLGMALLLVLCSPGSRADPLVVEGPAQVIDNETLSVWGQRVRLSGVTVPDPKSDDGIKGKRYLERLLADVRVRCEIAGPSLQKVSPGRCWAGNVDIARHLVQMGFARTTTGTSPSPRP